MKSLSCISVLAAICLQTPVAPAAVTIDDEKIAAAGIHKLASDRLTLYTDLAGPEIEELPRVFDLAFSQWCNYFGVRESDAANWRMTAFLMKDKVRFSEAGLLPDDLPPFEHGYSEGNTLWLYDQPSDYYRRHLLLHEGTHGFMSAVLGGFGPLWYMEGMAEYLATHRWRDGKLELGVMPADPDEAPMWGRIRLIQDAVAQRQALSLEAVTQFQPGPHRDTKLYAWCWAAVTLLDRHPRYQSRFRELARYVASPEFAEQFHKRFDADWQALSEEWQLMTADMEYGYDVARCAVDFTPGKPLDDKAAGTSVTIAADRGWQNSGLRLEAGITYRLTAKGRYQVATSLSNADNAAKRPTPWLSEPGGVSIRYDHGRPLGILLAAIRPNNPKPGSASALLNPSVVGLDTLISPLESGTLFLKINDSPGELSDNAGTLTVEVRPTSTRND